MGSINYSFIATADMRDDLSAVTCFEMRATALENSLYYDCYENYKETDYKYFIRLYFYTHIKEKVC